MTTLNFNGFSTTEEHEIIEKLQKAHELAWLALHNSGSGQNRLEKTIQKSNVEFDGKGGFTHSYTANTHMGQLGSLVFYRKYEADGTVSKHWSERQ